MPKTPLTRLLDYIIMVDDGSIPVNVYFRIENLMEAEQQMVVDAFNDGCSIRGDGDEYFEKKFGTFGKQLIQ
jgi:hypothetical protein